VAVLVTSRTVSCVFLVFRVSKKLFLFRGKSSWSLPQVIPLQRNGKDMHRIHHVFSCPLKRLAVQNVYPVNEPIRSLHLKTTLQYSTSRPSLKSRPVNFDILGTWDSRVELPLELEASIDYGKPIPKISASAIGAHTLQGRRPYNEDRIVVKEIRPNLLYCAVFDGHGGSECADFCYNHFEDHLIYWIEREEGDYQKALDSAFLELNNAFGRWWAYNGQATANASGSTATVALLYKNIELYLAHVGDSRAILCRNGQARRLTTDHCPTLLAEKVLKLTLHCTHFFTT